MSTNAGGNTTWPERRSSGLFNHQILSEEEATALTAGAGPSQTVDVPTTTSETPTIDWITSIDQPPLPQIGPVFTRPKGFETAEEIKHLLSEQAANLSKMMVSVMAEQQARQDAQVALFAEQLKPVRQERKSRRSKLRQHLHFLLQHRNLTEVALVPLAHSW